MVKLESAAELKDWTTYRKFLKERLRALPPEGSPFFVSKEKFSFSIDGKPWMGHAVLFEKRGQMAVRILKKEQVRFREGWVVERDGVLSISELPSPIVKFANKTIKHLKLGLSLVTHGEEEDADADSSDVTAKLSRLEAKNLPRVKRLSGLLPDERAEIAKALREAVDARRAGDHAAALESQEILDAYLESLEREVSESGADDPELQATFDKLDEKNRARGRRLVEWIPDMAAHLEEMLAQIDDLKDEGDLREAVRRQEGLADYIGTMEASAKKSGLADPRAGKQLDKLERENLPRAQRLMDTVPNSVDAIRRNLEDAERQKREGQIYAAIREHEALETLLDFFEFQAQAGGSGDPALEAELSELAARSAPRVARLKRQLPSEAKRIDYRLDNVRAFQHEGDLNGAIREHRELAAFLDELEIELEDRGANDPAAHARLKELEKKNISRAKLVADLVPGAKGEILSSLRDVTKAKKEGDVNSAIGALEILDEYLTSVEMQDVLE